jgi:hypothetical protein
MQENKRSKRVVMTVMSVKSIFNNRNHVGPDSTLLSIYVFLT